MEHEVEGFQGGGVPSWPCFLLHDRTSCLLQPMLDCSRAQQQVCRKLPTILAAWR